MPDRLAYNSAETRRMLGGVSETTLWRLTARGLIRPVMGIRHKIYSRREIERYLDVQTKGGA